MKKILALVVAMLLVMGMVSAFAADAGSITLTNAEIGAKYKLYKLFDATVAPDGSIAYKLPENKDVENDTFFNTYFEIKNGNIVKKAAFTDDVLKTDEFKTWAEGFGTQVGDEKTAAADTIEWTDLDYGYYFMTSSLGAVITVDSTNPHADVIDKNQTVNLDKNIVLQAAAEGKEEILTKFNEAGLDIPVPFVIDVKAKNYEGTEKIFKYRVKDTIDPGFTFTDDPVVTVGDTTLVAGTDYTIKYYATEGGAEVTNKAQAQYFEIIIPWTSDGTVNGTHLYSNNANLRVAYNAKLDPAKADKVKVGTDPNLNEGEVDYWKDDDKPEVPSGNKPKKTTKTWETELTIIKHDGENNIMTGAQFTLTSEDGSTKVSYVYESKYVEDDAGTYYKLKDNTYTDEAPTGNATHDAVYESTTTKYKLETVATVMGEGQTPSTISSYVGADGTVKFSGLGTGTYKIEETVVPAGYNKADDIEFTIEFEIDEDTDPENPTGKFKTDSDKVTLKGTTNTFETTVINNKGAELPSTGGIGTTIFYVAGSILVLAAVVLLVTKRRMSAGE